MENFENFKTPNSEAPKKEDEKKVTVDQRYAAVAPDGTVNVVDSLQDLMETNEEIRENNG